MNQEERRIFLIEELLKEEEQFRGMEIPEDEAEQKRLLRSLFNIRPPRPVHEMFLKVQDAYLSEVLKEKGVTDIRDLEPIQKDIYLWQGDIILLKADVIVNAANSQMLGCFCPCHSCIDNAIHTFSGIQLRLACADIMRRQGHDEKVGTAKITSAFNLPCKYVLHTVGPMIQGDVTEMDCRLLSGCYRSCMELAEERQLKSIAFCCISTGEFRFPKERAAKIAIDTVKAYKKQKNSEMKVVFNVFRAEDYGIYKKLLA